MVDDFIKLYGLTTLALAMQSRFDSNAINLGMPLGENAIHDKCIHSFTYSFGTHAQYRKFSLQSEWKRVKMRMTRGDLTLKCTGVYPRGFTNQLTFKVCSKAVIQRFVYQMLKAFDPLPTLQVF